MKVVYLSAVTVVSYMICTKRRTLTEDFEVSSSLQYFLCSVTLLAWNGGFFEKYEVCGGLSFLFCYMTGTKQRTLWGGWGLWRTTVVILLLIGTKRRTLWKVWGLGGLPLFCYHTGAKQRTLWRVWGLCRFTVVLFPDWYETEDALKSMRSWRSTIPCIPCCSFLWLIHYEGRIEEYDASGGLLLLFCYLPGSK